MRALAGLDESAQAELTVALKQLEESEQWEHHLGALLGAQVLPRTCTLRQLAPLEQRPAPACQVADDATVRQ